jgi:molybdopterin molybdotransferase
MENFMISVSEAQTQILNSLSPLNIETIEIKHSLNRILAQPIIADQDSPSFDNSSMDGIAVIASDVGNASPDHPIKLDLIGSIPAGVIPDIKVKPGQAMQIMTGAPMPDGADAVIQVEHTDLDFSKEESRNQVLVYHPTTPGTNIRKKGEFYAKDEVLLNPGQKLRPQDIAVIAMTGSPLISVTRKPIVGLLTTGDELTPPGDPISPGKIRDTNSYMLASLLEDAGAEVIRTGIIPDSEDAVTSALNQLIRSEVDIILTSGGVSMGVYDIVRKVLEIHGQLKLWRVNMRPGKPLAYGKYQGKPFIGLPGNPVSAFVGFYIFVRPMLQKMIRGEFIPYHPEKARLLHAVKSDGRETYIPAKLSRQDNEWEVAPAFNQSSGNIFALIPGNSLIILPIGVKFLNKGEFVDVLKLELT